MQQFVDDFRQRLKQKARAESLGVILADSRVVPFRLGISGVALAWSGLLGVSDERGKPDLFGKPLKVSRLAIADNLASLAQLFFGQAAEQTPFVLINDAPVAFSDTQQDYKSAQIDPADDLYAPLFRA
jgi:F420-0:gamma-glutamyl ligase